MAQNVFPPLQQDSLRALDQLRQRLNQLSTSLGSLKVDLERNEPLPSWTSLQSSAQILAHNLSQLLSTFDAHREFLSAAHAYPLTTFPGHSQEPLLNQLLRKRLEPAAEDWIKEYSDRGTATSREDDRADDARNDTFPKHGQDTGLKDDDLKELWLFAGPASNAIVKQMIEDEAFEDDFTLAEREAGVEDVKTGLTRKLWEDDEEEDGQEEGTDKMEDVVSETPGAGSGPLEISGLNKPALSMEVTLRAMSTGKIPPP